ncbi:hypothetical protein BT93_L4252 [Corymbia citriodora subsp. variegata]|uniref:High-temperature-induced dauer-formation protein n=1 Tax=Corymbia citriodora subsp. variegata TaxID=360336 RepID=A0A8T0CH52_CORYI|nr:hypothetical protein BT93_L4252 [Corymbia citriodora subsp. variegata]
MGASESKLHFKQGIFRLSEEQAIPADDPYWTGFWELPESVEDVFSLFAPSDIRRTRDSSPENFATLLQTIITHLIELKNHPSFPDPELSQERDALNCIRVLTRLLPYVYETDDLANWRETFFWGPRTRRKKTAQSVGQVLFDESQLEEQHATEEYEAARPLAEELIDTVTDLLFTTSFTIPRLTYSKSTVNYSIWQSGVGCKTSLPTSNTLDSNRCEVLRLLLTLASESMYSPSTELPVMGTRTLTYLTTCPDKQIVLSVLCSLLNTTIKHNTNTWRLPYDQLVIQSSKQSLAVYSLQLMLILLIYPVPDPAQKNQYRHFLARLHRPEDFQFLADGLTRVLSQPTTTNTYLPGSQRQSKYAPEAIMLFWELLQANRRFRSFIIESNRMHDFVVLMVYYAVEHKSDSSWQGVVRMCIFVLQTMSVEPTFGKNLNKRFEAQDTLPAVIRLPNFRGTHADFLLTHVENLITSSKGRLDAVFPALLAIMSNISAYTQHLATRTSSKLFNLFAVFSSPSFLLANEDNYNLLVSLLESINTILEHQYAANPSLVYVACRYRRQIDTLRKFSIDGAQQLLDEEARRRKEGLDIDGHDMSRPTQTNISDSPSSRRTSTQSQPHSIDDGTFALADSDESDNEESAPPIMTQSMSAGSSSADAVPSQVRGMSEKARGKRPVGVPAFARQGSTLSMTQTISHSTSFQPTSDWLDTWLPDLPLHTLITITKALSSRLPSATNTNTANSSARRSESTSPRQSSEAIHTLLTSIPSTVDLPPIQAILSSPSPIRVHLFEWTPLSLGWYLSILWSLVYSSEMHVSTPTSATTTTVVNTVTGGTGNAIGPIGVWNGTAVKLFNVATEGRRVGPTLSQPRGAVDAVGTKLVDGLKGLNLGGLMGRASANFGALSGNTTNNASIGRDSVREV